MNSRRLILITVSLGLLISVVVFASHRADNWQYKLTTTTEYVWIPAQAVRAPGAKPATYTDVGISGAWSFADGQEEIIVANMKFPLWMDYSKDSSLCIGWSSSAVSKDCDWEVAYLITALNGDVTAGADATVAEIASSSSNANGMVITAFTIAGGTITANDVCIHANFMCDGNDTSHTLGADALVHGVALGYVPTR